MTPTTILFDLDGTLTDSGKGIINCAAMTLERYGLPVPSWDQMRVFVGPPLHETFMRFGIPEEEADNAVEIFRSRYNTVGKFENAPYPGIREMLEKLQKDGHRLFVATSKPEKVAKEILAHFDLERYFSMICGATESRSRTEKAEVIDYLLVQVGSDGHTVMVGDTAFDVLGAKHHGIGTIGVSWGYGKVEDMRSAGAVAIAHDAQALLQLLEQ